MPYKDPAAKKASDKAYKERNSERLAAYDRDRAHTPERKAQRRKANSKYYRSMTEAQREKARQYTRDYRKANPLTTEQKAKANAGRKERYFLKKYGVSKAEIGAILAAQGGVCKICGADQPGSRFGWHTDHCHVLNIIRGILCRRCNVNLGNFEHDPELLRKAADYLEEFAGSAESGIGSPAEQRTRLSKEDLNAEYP